MSYRLVHRKVGTQHLITSPDIPGLYVAHEDEDTARAAVEPAIKMLEEMKERRAARDAVQRKARGAA